MLALYLPALIFILFYSFSQAYLAWRYLERKKDPAPLQPDFVEANDYPLVSIQLPVYNEKYVISRLIDAVAQFNYPAEKMEIQILDDSTDETTGIIEQKVNYWQKKGLDINSFRRRERKGYKAGALAEALPKAQGAYILYFDADFLPGKDFIKKILPYFSDPRLGMVQARWEHIDRNYSLLTQLQAFALDGHFRIEQVGRNRAGCFINFNGTAGIWRKSCIEDAGGWQSDTLTEDLDLSYRAQLKGWQFLYLENVSAPAELPPVMSAIKSQQYRWTKGGAENARKLLGKVLLARQPLKVKLLAFFHLLNTLIFPAVLISSLLSWPIVVLQTGVPELQVLYEGMSIFIVSFLIIACFYFLANNQTRRDRLSFLIKFPLFIAVSAALSLHNTVAAFEGFWGRKTPFMRTPKFNIYTKKDRWKNNAAYLQANINLISIIEGLLVFYFAAGTIYALTHRQYLLLFFQLILMTGFGLVFYYSLFQKVRRKS